MDDEAEDLFLGYSNLECERAPLKGKYFKEFLEGIRGLSKRDLFLFRERKLTSAAIGELDLEQVLEQESDSHLINAYDTAKVEAGIAPMTILYAGYSQRVYKWILGCLSSDRIVPGQKLTRNKLTNILESCPFEVHFEQFDYLNQRVGEYVSRIHADSAAEALHFALFLEVITPLIKIYEECVNLQTRNRVDRRTIKWNIRTEAEYFIDEPWERIEAAGLQYLRAPVLLASEQRKQSMRREFDQCRLAAAYDEFKLSVGFLIDGFTELDQAIMVNGFEQPCFKTAYKQFSDEQRERHRFLELHALEEIRRKYPHVDRPVLN